MLFDMIKKYNKLLLSIISIIAVLGLLIEIINPHSFLSSGRAYASACILIIVAIIWMVSLQKSTHRTIGAFVLLATACLYGFYGTSMYCQDTYYERYMKNDPTNLHPKEYSCIDILQTSLLR